MRRHATTVLVALALLAAAPAAVRARPAKEQHRCAKCRDGWRPCPQCADEETKAKFEAVRALYAKERRGEGFYEWGEGFFLAACEHYRFKAAASHDECHEFHAVAEGAFDLFERIFGEEGVEALQWHEKGHFLILSSRDQYLTEVPRVVQERQERG